LGTGAGSGAGVEWGVLFCEAGTATDGDGLFWICGGVDTEAGSRTEREGGCCRVAGAEFVAGGGAVFIGVPECIALREFFDFFLD